jgi:D-tyrosyl-tRNA(Tyr) deacylase
VKVDGETVGEIGAGLLVLIGVGQDDDPATAAALVDKLVGLRIFQDDAGKMNLSVAEVAGSVLVVSQFTLLADVRKGRRPSFTAAAPPEVAAELVEQVAALIEERGIPVAMGRFGAMMQVELVNDGPVTVVVDAADGRIQ